jgi:pimeloyl-ACP methyl ester carboxylesterase
MSPVLSVVSMMFLSTPAVDTRFAQVAPVVRDAASGVRSAGQERAVVLLHGLYPHPFSKDNVNKALFRDWQKPESRLVKHLAQDSDVFAFAYAQNVAVEEVTQASDLRSHIRRLRQLGYRDIVLVGHSAGGVIAREFVEDYPREGVTKVVQVCAPNGGSSWARLPAMRSNQSEFLASLTKSKRRSTLNNRGDRLVPAHVEFACIVGTGAINSDGLVLCRCQWTDDLQDQGIPAYPIGGAHWSVPSSGKGVELIARLVREPQPRWDAGRVATLRRQVLGN